MSDFLLLGFIIDLLVDYEVKFFLKVADFISRKSESIYEFKGFSSFDLFNASFFLDPGFHENNLPGTVNGNTPKRELFDDIYWD